MPWTVHVQTRAQQTVSEPGEHTEQAAPACGEPLGSGPGGGERPGREELAAEGACAEPLIPRPTAGRSSPTPLGQHPSLEVRAEAQPWLCGPEPTAE